MSIIRPISLQVRFYALKFAQEQRVPYPKVTVWVWCIEAKETVIFYSGPLNPSLTGC